MKKSPLDNPLVDKLINKEITIEQYRELRSAVNRNKPIFSGKFNNYLKQIEWLKKQKIVYEEKISGSIITVSYGGGSYYYTTNDNDSSAISAEIARACADVLRCVRKYIKDGGTILTPTSKVVSVFNNPKFTTEYILSGKRDVYLIDINHCYWRIAFNLGLITEKIYEKHKDNRDSRLVSIGNLGKGTTYKYFENGEWKKVYKDSSFRWAWDYICFKAYEVVNEAYIQCSGKMFAYQTDGVYVPEESVNIVCDVFAKLGFSYKIKHYKIKRVSVSLGANTLGVEIERSSHYLVLADDDGNEKRANLGMTEAIKRELSM